MPDLGHDTYSRQRVDRPVYRPQSAVRVRSVGVMITMLAALALLALGRAENGWLTWIRAELTEAVEPALGLLRLPVDGARALANATSSESELLKQNLELKRELSELRQWRLRAEELESQVSELRRIVGGVPDRKVGIVTGRVFIEARNAFSNSAVIDLGTKSSVKTGYAAVSGDGLVGAVVEVAENSSRVLLLTDRRSRIPVFIGKRRLRGILAGNGSETPTLELATAAFAVETGELVTTSGEDGVFPRGIPVGFVEVSNGSSRVRLAAALDRLDYVSLLLSQSPMSSLAAGDAVSNQ
ncbi:MAG: rod shape-determining protein MreC [Hyphomicrobiaceae bacterium]